MRARTHMPAAAPCLYAPRALLWLPTPPPTPIPLNLTPPQRQQEDEEDDDQEDEPPPPPDLDDVPQEFMFDAVGVPMEAELLSFAAKQRSVRWMLLVCCVGSLGISEE